MTIACNVWSVYLHGSKLFFFLITVNRFPLCVPHHSHSGKYLTKLRTSDWPCAGKLFSMCKAKKLLFPGRKVYTGVDLPKSVRLVMCNVAVFRAWFSRPFARRVPLPHVCPTFVVCTELLFFCVEAQRTKCCNWKMSPHSLETQLVLMRFDTGSVERTSTDQRVSGSIASVTYCDVITETHPQLIFLHNHKCSGRVILSWTPTTCACSIETIAGTLFFSSRRESPVAAEVKWHLTANKLAMSLSG